MGSRFSIPQVSGPLAPFQAGFSSWLRSRSYSHSAVRGRVGQFGQLSAWLEREGLTAGELTPLLAAEFMRSLREADKVPWTARLSLDLPLEYLRGLGVVPLPAVPVPEGLTDELIAEYIRYLLVERGLGQETIRDSHEPVARLLLAGREGPDGLGLDRLSAADVSAFMIRECGKRSVSGARELVGALRSFLRFLHLTGRTEASLVWAVLPVAALRNRTLARGLDPTVVTELLAAPDRRTLIGLRDYAILLVLSRLGLRAGEVAAIELEDIDWRAGLLHVRGKAAREDVLPLPVDVGEAIVAYLQVRPRCASRAVFLRTRAPIVGVARGAIGSVVATACERAGVPRVGAHRLRHTAATAMLSGGASLGEVGQVLRHSELLTTTIYAKVHLDPLRALARPWPIREGGAA